LTCGEGIVFIVENDIGDIEITATCMDKMPHADTISITISSHDDHGEIRVCELYSCSKRHSTTMKSLRCISIDILRSLSRASHS
jgi:hypothetical protein